MQDLVEHDGAGIKFFLPFDETFPTQPFPKTIEAYQGYIENTLAFVEARGKRMERYMAALT